MIINNRILKHKLYHSAKAKHGAVYIQLKDYFLWNHLFLDNEWHKGKGSCLNLLTFGIKEIGVLKFYELVHECPEKIVKKFNLNENK